jgi:hypothetical protein
VGASKSTLSTGAKAAIAGAAWLLRLHLWQYAFSPSSFFPADLHYSFQVLILVCYRNTHDKHTPPPPPRAIGKKDPWYSYRYVPRPPPPQSRGPFMPMGTRAPVDPDARTSVADTDEALTVRNSGTCLLSLLCLTDLN